MGNTLHTKSCFNAHTKSTFLSKFEQHLTCINIQSVQQQLDMPTFLFFYYAAY